MDVCYYSLIWRADDGRFVGSVPDLPGVTASASSEAEVLRDLSRTAREFLRGRSASGLPPPAASPPDALPQDDPGGRYRRLLLILS